MDSNLLSWTLSILGGLFSFVAIFTALETFYVQDWLGKSNRADAAYRKVSELHRKPEGFSNDQDRTLQSSRQIIKDAVDLFPGALVAFFAVVGLITTAISVVFYSAASSAVSSGMLYWAGLSALVLLSAAILVVVIYSFFKHSRIKSKSEEVEEFADPTKKYETLREAREALLKAQK